MRRNMLLENSDAMKDNLEDVKKVKKVLDEFKPVVLQQSRSTHEKTLDTVSQNNKQLGFVDTYTRYIDR